LVERRSGTGHTAALAAGGELQRLIKATIGVSVQVLVEKPGGVERSAGKMRRVVDER
jgi:phenylacetate-CoA ligase